MVPIFRFLIISFFLFSCEEKKLGVIHWSTDFQNLPIEKKYCDSLGENIPWMVRYFDIVWEKNQAVPTAITSIPSNFKVQTSAIFIQRQVMESTPKSQISNLAQKISSLIGNLEKEGNESDVLLLDFDWGKTTKANYFQLIADLKKLLPQKKISSTIRLSQYANPLVYGVPPSDHGLLMMYQTGSLNQPEKPLLWEKSEVEKYTAENNYPLPLDVAIPTFSWSIIRRNVSVSSKKNFSIVFPSHQQDLLQDKNFKQIKFNVFSCINPHFFHGFFLLEGDIITCEKVSKNELKWALNLASRIKRVNGHIYLYLIEEAANGSYPAEWFQ